MLRTAVLGFFTFFTICALAKSEEPQGFLVHEFPAGQKVIFRTGTNGLQGIFFVNEAGKARQIEQRHTFFIGQSTGMRKVQLNLTSRVHLTQLYAPIQSSNRLAFAIMGPDVILIRPDGQHRKIHIIPAGTPSYHEMTVHEAFTFHDGTKQYLYLAYSVNTWPNKAMAILVDDEDLRFATTEVEPEIAANGSVLFPELLKALPENAPELSIPSGEEVSVEFAQGKDVEYKPLKDITVLDNSGNSVSAIELLQKFSTNLTEKFKKSPIPSSPSDSRQMEQIAEALAGYEITSVAFLGYPGTGKTTDINMMISEAANGRGPKFLRGYTFIKLEPGAMDGQKWRGSSETNITAIKALARENKIVYVVDEVHRLKGLASHSQKPHDATEDLKDDMAEGVMKLIGMSTEAEFYQAGFSKPFLERFVVVGKEEPKGADLLKILHGWINSRGLANPGDAFLVEAQKIAERFSGVGAQPRKTTKLLDAVYARLKLAGQEKDKPTIDLLHEVARIRLGFDPALIDPKQARHRLEQMVKAVDNQIIGQTEARALLERSTIRALSDIGDANGPRLKILFAGPEGQGKTTIAKAYAKGMGLPHVIIDMSQCRFGAQPGAGPLAQAASAIAINAFTVLVFDEVEKCAVEEQEKLLQALNSGRAMVQISTKAGLTGELVDFRNASVIFTTNAGSIELQNQSKTLGFVKAKRDEANRELLKGGQISRYLLDRIPDIAFLEPLNRTEFRAAVELHLNNLLARLSQNGVHVEFVGRKSFLDFAASLWTENISNRRILEILRPIDDYLAQEKLLNENLRLDQIKLEFDGRNLHMGRDSSTYNCEQILK